MTKEEIAKDIGMTNEKRIKLIEGLIKNKTILSTANSLVIERHLPRGESHIETLALFVKNEDDENKIYLATPMGVPLFPAKELFDYAREKHKEVYLEQLDRLVKMKQVATGILDI